MLKLALALLVLGLLAGLARANPDARMAVSPGEQCRGAIAAAERDHAIPPQLLAAIGRVESGRRDPTSGAWSPWPWTINAEGQGAWFDTKAAAISAVQGLRARGVRSIDVGCMQVNLMHHPNAFASLDLAFEPGVNADYAARFLLSLHDQTGDWTKATADYHSANPPEGGPYAAKVMAVWPEEQRRAGSSPPFGPGWNAGLNRQFTGSFPVHQPPRMVPLPGVTPGTPPGVLSMDGPRGGPQMAPARSMARIMSPGMMRAGTMQPETSPGGIAPPGMTLAGTAPAEAPYAQNSPGRGLAFYRAVPVRLTMPTRLAVRMPYPVFVR
jgi:hypothetical protein